MHPQRLLTLNFVAGVTRATNARVLNNQVLWITCINVISQEEEGQLKYELQAEAHGLVEYQRLIKHEAKELLKSAKRTDIHLVQFGKPLQAGA